MRRGRGSAGSLGKDKEKAFWGVDQDAHAFERFIRRFLTKYDRWNSPKYLFGESYGTPRSRGVERGLQNVDLNGIVLLSQILSFDNSVDGPKWNPGVDQAYALALADVCGERFLSQEAADAACGAGAVSGRGGAVCAGRLHERAVAGEELPEARKQAVAEKLHEYTGLPVAYLLKANLRVTGGMFEQGPAAG